jgi:hypothetical protein
MEKALAVIFWHVVTVAAINQSRRFRNFVTQLAALATTGQWNLHRSSPASLFFPLFVGRNPTHHPQSATGISPATPHRLTPGADHNYLRAAWRAPIEAWQQAMADHLVARCGRMATMAASAASVSASWRYARIAQNHLLSKNGLGG